MVNSITVFNQIEEYQSKEYKTVKELEIDTEYTIERFEKVKTKFGPSILCHLEEFKVNLLKTFFSKLDD